MSSAVAAVSNVFNEVTEPIQKPLRSGFRSLGFNDSTASTLAGGIVGSPLPGGALVGGFLGAEGSRQRRAIEDARKAAEQSEQARRVFNDDTFRTAQDLSRRSTEALDFDTDLLQFKGGDERQEELDLLVQNFAARQDELLGRIRSPGVAQTRQSLLG